MSGSSAGQMDVDTPTFEPSIFTRAAFEALKRTLLLKYLTVLSKQQDEIYQFHEQLKTDESVWHKTGGRTLLNANQAKLEGYFTEDAIVNAEILFGLLQKFSESHVHVVYDEGGVKKYHVPCAHHVQCQDLILKIKDVLQIEAEFVDPSLKSGGPLVTAVSLVDGVPQGTSEKYPIQLQILAIQALSSNFRTQIYIPSSPIEIQFPHFVHHPFVNRNKEVVEFACQSILNNLRHKRDDNTLSLILCIQRFGSGKTFFGYNLVTKASLEREAIIDRLVRDFHVSDTTVESELQRFSQAKVVYLNVQHHVGSLKTFAELRREIIACTIGALKESPEIPDAIREHFAHTNLETTPLKEIMKQLNQILVDKEKEKEKEKGRPPTQALLFIFDEISSKILMESPGATEIEKFYGFWTEINAVLTHHHYLYVIGHTHHLYSLGMGLERQKNVVSPGKVIRITMNPFEPEHIRTWYREEFPSQKPLTEEESKEIQAVTGGLPRITEKTLDYLNAKRTENPQASVYAILKGKPYLNYLLVEIPREIDPLRFLEDTQRDRDIAESYLQFVIFSLYQMSVNINLKYLNEAEGGSFSLLHAFEWLCIHFKSTALDNYVIPVIPPAIARGITHQMVRHFFLSMKSMAQGDKLEIASFYGLAFRYLDSVFYEASKFTLSDHFPYLKEAFCASEVLAPISFQLKTLTNEETLNSKIPAWDFPKMASNGSKEWNDHLTWLIQTSPEKKNKVRETLKEEIARVQKAHDEEKDPGKQAELKQDLDNRGKELEERTKLRVAGISLWPILIKAAMLRVIYQPGEKSASADKIIFFEDSLLVIQDKNVNTFNFQQLSDEIDKVKVASTTKKITMLLISRSLDSGMVEELNAREKGSDADSGRLAYRLGPKEVLSYHVGKKIKSEEAEANQRLIKIPENMEVFVLTELGVRHFISSYNFEKLVD